MKHAFISDQARRAADAFHKIHEIRESRREPLPHAQVAQFAALLQRTIGLDPVSIGEKAIERVVSERFAAWRAAGAEARRPSTRPEVKRQLRSSLPFPSGWRSRRPEPAGASVPPRGGVRVTRTGS